MPENLDLEARRKRLRFRSWHRGTREADLLLGGFADACLNAMTVEDLALFDAILDRPDPVLMAWMTGVQVCPASERDAVMDRLLQFCDARRGV